MPKNYHPKKLFVVARIDSDTSEEVFEARTKLKSFFKDYDVDKNNSLLYATYELKSSKETIGSKRGTGARNLKRGR